MLKLIVERVAKAYANASPVAIVARAFLLTNCMGGSKLLRAFQLLRGYRPTVLDIPARMVSKDIIEAYIANESTRALNQLMTARIPN